MISPSPWSYDISKKELKKQLIVHSKRNEDFESINYPGPGEYLQTLTKGWNKKSFNIRFAK